MFTKNNQLLIWIWAILMITGLILYTQPVQANDNHTLFNPGSLDVEFANCGGSTYSARFYWTNPATSGWEIHLAETGGFWPVEKHAIAYGTTDRWVTLTAGRTYCFRLQYGPNAADAVYGYCFTENDCGGGGTTSSPTNLRLEQVPTGCQSGNYVIKFEWDGSSTNWWLDVDTDPCFNGTNPNNCAQIGSFWNKDVSNLGSLMSNQILNLAPGQTYYWRMWDGSSHIYPPNGQFLRDVRTTITPLSLNGMVLVTTGG